MNDTFFSDDPTEIVKNRASGYKHNGKGGYQIDMTNLFWVGDGGLHTTLDDLLKWDKHFYEPSIGKNTKALLDLFNTPNSEFKADDGLYANGQVVTEVEGYKAYMHGGGWLGVSTYYTRIPQANFSTILLCNDVEQDAYAYAKKITSLYLNEL